MQNSVALCDELQNHVQDESLTPVQSVRAVKPCTGWVADAGAVSASSWTQSTSTTDQDQTGKTRRSETTGERRADETSRCWQRTRQSKTGTRTTTQVSPRVYLPPHRIKLCI